MGGTPLSVLFVLYCICVDWRDDPSAPVLYASDGRDLLASIVIVRDFAHMSYDCEPWMDRRIDIDFTLRLKFGAPD